MTDNAEGKNADPATDVNNRGLIVNGAEIKPREGIEVFRDRYSLKSNANPEDPSTLRDYMKVIIGQGLHMSDVFDRMPYGLIDKRATGIGATQLEMYSPRNSILVFPTRALAFSKYGSTPGAGLEHHGIIEGKEFQFFYVGGIADDTMTVENIFQAQWNNRRDSASFFKLFVVADSLQSAMAVANIDGRGVSEKDRKYFLLIDEFDTYQTDSTYRTKFADVLDTYFNWAPELRALVSATFRHRTLRLERGHSKRLFPSPETNDALLELNIPHSSMEGIREEPWTIIDYVNAKRPDFQLRYTAEINKCTTDAILRAAGREESRTTILVAYNNVKNIAGIVQRLQRIRSDWIFRTLYSEYTENKNLERIRIRDFDGRLRKDEDGDSTLVVFMTCAFYVGIDIYDENCHLVMVSSLSNDFSLLSLQRIRQIMGRLRNGAASCTIIYNSLELTKVCKGCELLHECYDNDECGMYESCKKRKRVPLPPIRAVEESYLERARQIASLQNAVTKLLKMGGSLPVISERTLKKINDLINRDLVMEEGFDPVPLTREDKNEGYKPHYLNIDAMVDQWNTRNRLYPDRSSLPRELETYYGSMDNRRICPDDPVPPEGNMPPDPENWGFGSPMPSTTGEDCPAEALFEERDPGKDKEAGEQTEDFETKVRAFFDYDEGKEVSGNVFIRKSENGSIQIDEHIHLLRRIVDTYKDYLHFGDMRELVLSYLFSGKTKKARDVRNLSKIHAAIGFMLMEDTHPFKRSILTEFGYPSSPEGTSLRLKKPILISDKKEKMKEIMAAYRTDSLIPLPNYGVTGKRKDRIVKVNTIQINKLSKLIDCFFEKAGTNNLKKGEFKIKGLYPKEFKEERQEEGRESQFVLRVTPRKRIKPENGVDFFQRYFLIDL